MKCKHQLPYEMCLACMLEAYDRAGRQEEYRKFLVDVSRKLQELKDAHDLMSRVN